MSFICLQSKIKFARLPLALSFVKIFAMKKGYMCKLPLEIYFGGVKFQFKVMYFSFASKVALYEVTWTFLFSNYILHVAV